MNSIQKSCNIGPAPLSTDTESIKAREECDYSIKISLEDAKAGRAPRTVRVYADGIFDLFHLSHVDLFRQIKTQFGDNVDVRVIAGVSSDEDTHRLKGLTVMNENERYESVRNCRYVDELNTNIPWVITDEFLKEQKIDFVAHDAAPYKGGDQGDIYAPLKARGMFIGTTRGTVSTSDLICRVISRYDDYLMRNYSRGMTGKELNIGILKETELQMKTAYQRAKLFYEEYFTNPVKEWIKAKLAKTENGNHVENGDVAEHAQN